MFLQAQIERGIMLCDLVEQLNKALQCLVAVTIITCLIGSVVCLYFVTSIAFFYKEYFTILVWYIYLRLLNFS